MKISSVIFSLFILFPAISFAQSDSIHFRDVSLQQGLKMAQAEKKVLFFMGYASWCEHCKHMKEVIFKDSVVADYFNKHFVCVKQDMEKGEGIKLHAAFQVRSFPTFVFLDSSGTTLYQCNGEYNDSAMIAQGKIALTPESQYPYMKKEFEKDITNAEKCYEYVFALRKAMLDCSEPAEKYLATQSDAQLLSALNWKIIANGVRNINSRPFQFVLAHQKEYAAIASPLRVERKIINIADELLTPYVTVKDSAGYFSNRPLAASMHYPKVDSLIFKLDISMYEKLGNWQEYKKVTIQSAETYAWNNLSQLKDIINNYLIHVSDTAALLTATVWAKHALQINEEYSSYVVCAKLYQKAGDKKAAIEMAQRGKDFAMKYGWEHNDADKLINELQK